MLALVVLTGIALFIWALVLDANDAVKSCSNSLLVKSGNKLSAFLLMIGVFAALTELFE